MRLVSFREDGGQRLGLVAGDVVVAFGELARADGRDPAPLQTMASLLDGGEAVRRSARDLAERLPRLRDRLRQYPFDKVALLAPVPRPGKIIAIGQNYRDHCAEQNIPVPAEPVLFAKFPSSVAGPRDTIVIPREDPKVDFEGELAFVIGRAGKRIAAERALEHVAGYMVANDVSARAWQFADGQWVRGKSPDTFCPLGPCLVTPDEVADPHALRIQTRVNGAVMQDSTTSNLVFGVGALIAHISAAITLEPGDVVLTGTPPGVGCFRKPPRYLRPGDLVEVEIEGLGGLRNPVAAEA